jgi:hypothetical protein
MIILAHVDPPEAIFQARNFDVPLMVIVAGLSFRASYKYEFYLSYLWKRAKRLLFPVWLFFSIYFFEIFTTGYPIAVPSKKTILSSYLLLDGSDYVWIIRVFLLVAIVSPFLLSFCQRTTSHTKYLSAIITIYIAYELTLSISKPFLNTYQGYFFQETFLYLVPYAVVFSIGLRLPQLSRNQLLLIAAIAFCVFDIEAIALWIVSGQAVPTQNFKYPPQIYYLSYAIFVSIVTWILSKNLSIILERLHLSSAIQFVARNSLWIYLWHIPLIEIITFPFYLKYPIVFAGAVLLTSLQVRFIKQVVLPKVDSPSLKRNLILLFTG